MYKNLPYWLFDADKEGAGGAGDTPPPPVKEDEKPAAEVAEGAKPEDGDGGEQKVPEWAQRRINTVTGKLRESERTADDIRAQNAMLLAELTRLKETGGAKAEESDDKPPPAPVLQPGTAAFDAAVDAKLAAQRFNDACVAAYGQGTTKYKDFDAVVRGTLNSNLGAGENPTFYQAVIALENPADVLYHLGKNPAEAEKILAMPLAKQATALAKLEITLQAPPKPKDVSKAPPPSGARVDAARDGSIDELRDEMPIEDWMAARAKQVENRRGARR